MPPRASPGPMGFGDPNDQSLSKTELNCIVRQIKARIVREEKCKEVAEAYYDCVCNEGLMFSAMRCKNKKLDLHECVELWDQNEEIWSRAKKHYLNVRTNFRRTGIAQPNEVTVNEVLLNPPRHEYPPSYKQQL